MWSPLWLLTAIGNQVTSDFSWGAPCVTWQKPGNTTTLANILIVPHIYIYIGCFTNMIYIYIQLYNRTLVYRSLMYVYIYYIYIYIYTAFLRINKITYTFKYSLTPKVWYVRESNMFAIHFPDFLCIMCHPCVSPWSGGGTTNH